MTIEMGHVQKPTGQIIGDLTIDTKRRITWQLSVDSPTQCAVRVFEVPVSKDQVRVEFHFKRGFPPLWWGKKYQRAIETEMYAMSNRLIVAQQTAQKKVIPTGKRDRYDIEKNG